MAAASTFDDELFQCSYLKLNGW